MTGRKKIKGTMAGRKMNLFHTISQVRLNYYILNCNFICFLEIVDTIFNVINYKGKDTLTIKWRNKREVVVMDLATKNI